MPDTGVLSAIASLAIIALFIFIRIRQYQSAKKRRAELLSSYPQQPIFICNSASKILDNKVQIFGESYNTELRAGMELTNAAGAQGKIIEVYADDDTPDTPDLAVPANVPETPIVIEIMAGDWNQIRRSVSKTNLMLFKVKSPVT